MTSMFGKLAFVFAATAGLCLAAATPTPIAAAAIHWSQGMTAATGNSDALRTSMCSPRVEIFGVAMMKCVLLPGVTRGPARAAFAARGILWSCNDVVGIPGRPSARARDSYAYHPCDHANQIARDGTHCGNRAADRRAGGR